MPQREDTQDHKLTLQKNREVLEILTKIRNIWAVLHYCLIAQVGNLHEDQGVTLDFFIMADVDNLDACLGGYFSLFL